MRDANSTAALAYRELARRDFIPGRQTQSVGVTTRPSGIFAFVPTPKKHVDIDIVLFVPSQSKVCRAADLFLISAFVVAGLFAALAVVARQFGAFQ